MKILISLITLFACFAGCARKPPAAICLTPRESLLAMYEALQNDDLEKAFEYTEPSQRFYLANRFAESAHERKKSPQSFNKEIVGEGIIFGNLAFVPMATPYSTTYILMKKNEEHWRFSGNDPEDILKATSYALSVGNRDMLLKSGYQASKIFAKVFEDPSYDGFPKVPFEVVKLMEKKHYYAWFELRDAEGKTWDAVLGLFEGRQWQLSRVEERKGPVEAFDARKED